MIQNIIFDFDGVILESNEVKAEGFYLLFKDFGEQKALQAKEYFKNNAGFSRYDIIEYFFQTIHNSEFNQEILKTYATQYSQIVKKEVLNCSFVQGCQEFIENNQKYNLFIISSSDEKDLLYFCQNFHIEKYFKAILGSPTKKAINIETIMTKYNLQKKETVYIGDSFNDYKATKQNDLTFIGRDSGIFNFSQIDDIIIIKNLINLNKIIKGLKC